MTESIKALVGRTTDYKDADKMVTLITEDKGIISALARGVRRRSSRISPAVMPFTYCDFQLYKHGSHYIIDDGDILAQFMGLTLDIEKMALASYLAQLALWEQGSTHSSPLLLRLILNSIYAIDKNLAEFSVIKAAFELKCCQIWGFEPALGSGEKAEGSRISLIDGAITREQMGMAITPGAIQAIRYILSADVKKLLSFSVDELSLKSLSDFSEGYILDKIEYKPKTLDFYYNIINQTENLAERYNK